jgi:hypothetical protein
LVLGLAVWRLSSLFVEEEGPFLLFTRLRYKVGAHLDSPTGFWGHLLSCIWCFSIYLGLFWGFLHAFRPILAFRLALPWALSAVAIAIKEIAITADEEAGEMADGPSLGF